MHWRQIVLNNLWWKLLAFALAVMIWSGAQKVDVSPFTEPFRPPEVRSFPDVPIRIVARPEHLGPVRVTPESVRVDVEGDPTAVRHLLLEDLMAYVELPAESGTRPVEVRLPPGIKLLHLSPLRVEVSAVPRLSKDEAPVPTGHAASADRPPGGA